SEYAASTSMASTAAPKRSIAGMQAQSGSSILRWLVTVRRLISSLPPLQRPGRTARAASVLVFAIGCRAAVARHYGVTRRFVKDQADRPFLSQGHHGLRDGGFRRLFGAHDENDLPGDLGKH